MPARHPGRRADGSHPRGGGFVGPSSRRRRLPERPDGGPIGSVRRVSRFYATTPIYYVNAEPHIGHAYSTIVGDAVTRWHRLLGQDVKFLTGTDEHGLKIQQAAAAAGLDPKAFADGIAPRFADAWASLDVANDDFIRTTEPRHYTAVAELLQRCYDAGDIELDHYRGKYCVRCEAYYTDDDLLPWRARHSRCGPRPVSDPQDTGRPARGGELLLPPVALRGTPARLVRRPPRRHRPRVPRQRGPRPDPLGPQGLLDQPHQPHVGHPAAVGPEARRLRLVRRPHQLHQRRRVRPRRRRVRRVVAGRPPRHRQGHHPLPLRLLAGDADVGRPRTAPALRGRWLAPRRQREDVEVDRQRGRPARHGRHRRRRRPALLRARRHALWQRRRLHRRRPDRALQRRPRQQPRQPDVARRHGGRLEVRQARDRRRRPTARSPRRPPRQSPRPARRGTTWRPIAPSKRRGP